MTKTQLQADLLRQSNDSKLWEYGGAYLNYDMTETIELPFDSKVAVCDWITELPEFMKEADTLLVDPPWNMGNVNTFYYKAGKPHRAAFDFPLFSERFFRRVDEIAPRFLFVEMGKQFLSLYLTECQKRYKYVTFYNSTYYKKRDNKCYVIHACNESKRRRYKELEDLDEAKIIEWICGNHDYECIGDLCMGRGLVGKHAFLNNRKFVGIELNEKRLAVLVDFIQQVGKDCGVTANKTKTVKS